MVPEIFSGVSRKNEKEKGKVINTGKWKTGQSIFCQDRKGCLNWLPLLNRFRLLPDLGISWRCCSPVLKWSAEKFSASSVHLFNKFHCYRFEGFHSLNTRRLTSCTWPTISYNKELAVHHCSRMILWLQKWLHEICSFGFTKDYSKKRKRRCSTLKKYNSIPLPHYKALHLYAWKYNSGLHKHRLNLLHVYQLSHQGVSK